MNDSNRKGDDLPPRSIVNAPSAGFSVERAGDDAWTGSPFDAPLWSNRVDWPLDTENLVFLANAVDQIAAFYSQPDIGERRRQAATMIMKRIYSGEIRAFAGDGRSWRGDDSGDPLAAFSNCSVLIQFGFRITLYPLTVVRIDLERLIAHLGTLLAQANLSGKVEPWRVKNGETMYQWFTRPEVMAEARRRYPEHLRGRPSLAAMARAYASMTAPERVWGAQSIEAELRLAKVFAGEFPKKIRTKPNIIRLIERK